MIYKNSILLLAGITLWGLSGNADGQFGFAGFGKKKNTTPILNPKAAQPAHSMFDFSSGRDGLLTFDGPITVVRRINENTQEALTGARDAIAKPFTGLKQVKLWPARDPNSDGSFNIIPDWMKPNSQPEVQQPTTLADWLSQPRPQ